MALEDWEKEIVDRIKARGNVPRHVAVIMDGNGRWARQRGLDRIEGHKEGINSVRDVVDASDALGIEVLTLYTFSTENWRRPAREVAGLMRLLVQTVQREVDELDKNNVRLMTIGHLSDLPSYVRQAMRHSIERLATNTGLTVNLALSYSSRLEISDAAQAIARDVQRGVLQPEEVTPEVFQRYLNTAGLPDPDLLIRTSGEKRISNFLLWQLAYTELYFTEVLWPDFRKRQYYEAIEEYQRRERRFGMVSEQLVGRGKTVHEVSAAAQEFWVPAKGN